jgi:hypothetical protein
VSIFLNANDDPWATSLDLLSPTKTATVHGDVEMVETYHPPQSHPDGPAMTAALERAAQRGREWRASRFYQPGFFGATP